MILHNVLECFINIVMRCNCHDCISLKQIKEHIYIYILIEFQLFIHDSIHFQIVSTF